MPTDLTVMLPNRPGALAEMGEALAKAGVNIDGFCAVTTAETGEIHLLVEDADTASQALGGAGMGVRRHQEVLVVSAEDKPGGLGEIMRRIANAGGNVGLAYLATETRVVIGADDLTPVRSAL
ncbi:MAG: ACT domain-containing protein [Thermoanaerobaculia bacterium]